MREFDNYPKSIKKAIRYIKQDAKKDELKEIKIMLERAIELRSVRID
ncbi:hypothetical protein [Bacillus sp. EB600]|nr:hypothetical protein [Bacillus sp. EB600]MCQ6278904.1 hypothetical protein [Bacillus sp. EB600]